MPSQDSRAFTLMEVLIAIAIGAMVLGILASAFSLAVRTWTKATHPPDTALDDLMEMLSAQLLHLSATPLMYQGSTAPLFMGNTGEIVFVTHFSAMGASRNCPVVAHYRYDSDRKTLAYEQIILSDPRSMAPSLDKMIERLGRGSDTNHPWMIETPAVVFSLRYEAPGETAWRDDWNQPNTFPQRLLVQAKRSEGGSVIARVVPLQDGKHRSSTGERSP